MTHSRPTLADSEVLRRVLEAATAGTGVIHDGELCDADDQLCALVGYSRDELLGQPLALLFPDLVEGQGDGLDAHRQLTLGRARMLDIRLRRMGGEIVTVQVNTVPLEVGHPERGVVLAVLDSAGRAQVEPDLRTFKTITDRAVHGVAIADMSGQIIYCNEAFAAAHGYGVDEVVGAGIARLYPDHHAAAVQELLSGFREHGRFGPTETWHRHKDGHEFPMLMSGIIGRDEVDGREYMAATAIDITDLRDSERQLRLQGLVLDQISDQVTVTDLEGNITFVNDALVRGLGFSREELLGRPVSFDGDDPTLGGTREEIVGRTLADGHWRGQVVNETKDGSRLVLDCRTSVVRDQTGNPVALCGIATDITQQLELHNRLRESEDRFRALHNASFGGIAIHDRGRILECNQGLVTMMGYEMDELVGMDGLRLIHEDDRAQVREKIASGTEEPYEVRSVTRDGLVFPVRLEARNIPYRGQRVRVVEFRDITELKQAEAEHAQLQEQLIQAQKMEAVGQLAGGVAHDFNNLLQVISGYGELAREQAGDDTDLADALDHVLKAGERARILVSQLLAFSRRQIMDMQVVDLNAIIAETLQMLRRIIGERIELHFVPGAELPPIRADQGQLGQILANLCVNARDAMPDGGVITITTRTADLGATFCARHPWATPGHYVELTVVDTGHGMPEETIQQVFEPFFTTKEVGEGTGLGLSTVYGLVKQHDATIHCESVEGRGTRFLIHFPCCDEPLAEVTEDEVIDLRPGAGTVLIAEDDDMVRDLNRIILERHGFEVLTARDGHAALELFNDDPDRIDVALLDVVMPGLSGRAIYEAMRRVRPALPVLFSSGYSRDIIPSEFIHREGLTHLQKPVSARTLLAAIQDAMQGRGPD